MDNLIATSVLIAAGIMWLAAYISMRDAYRYYRQARAYNAETKALLRTIESGHIATGVFEDGRETYEENDRRRGSYYQSIS